MTLIFIWINLDRYILKILFCYQNWVVLEWFFLLLGYILNTIDIFIENHSCCGSRKCFFQCMMAFFMLWITDMMKKDLYYLDYLIFFDINIFYFLYFCSRLELIFQYCCCDIDRAMLSIVMDYIFWMKEILRINI